TLARAESGPGYTYLRGENLAYNYPVVTSCDMNSDAACCVSQRAVTKWTREVFNVGRFFLVYDRSEVYNPSWDHFLAWHFPRTATEVPAPAGMHRYDVEDKQTFADGPAFKGTVHTILPASRIES